MFALLLVLGSVIAAAGLALVASGVSIQQHTFDASNVTPGTIAVIGGAILIGLAFVVRALLRVERALMARPVPRPMRPGETAGVGVTTAPPSEQARVPFPAKPVPPPQPATAEGATLEVFRHSASGATEETPVVEQDDAALSPNGSIRSDEDNRGVHHGVAARGNGAAAPQVAGSGRPVRRVQTQAKGSIFDSLWPKAQRAVSEAKAAPPAPATPPPVPASQQTEPASEPAQPSKPAAASRPPPAAVSILKSGVVEGMAYTLYSDGSIEAQLPGGTLRFGSITELRNHIEQNG